MGYFYFDESIREKGGFIVGAFVYAKADVTPAVFEALEKVGLRPGADEFKSGARMGLHPEQVAARELLGELLGRTRIGVLVVPASDRRRVGLEVLVLLRKILQANALLDSRHEVFVDAGIEVDAASLMTFRHGAGSQCELHLGQDSRLVGGIQLADLVAHSLGVMMLEQQGIVRKSVKAGENSGYSPDLDVELGFKLWASLRHSFFRASQPKPGPDPEDLIGELKFDVENYGLHLAQTCDDALREAALSCFGECYLGCIH